MRVFVFSILTVASLSAQVLREDFREVPAHIPVTSDDLVSEFLTLERLGKGADTLKLSHHPAIKNDPHYVWNGQCPGPTLLAFKFEHALDLSDKSSKIRLRSKNFGKSKLHLAIRVDGRWYVQNHGIGAHKDWTISELALHGKEAKYHSLNEVTCKIGKRAPSINFGRVSALGFLSSTKPNRSKDCTRLDWFSLHSSSAVVRASKPERQETGFIEQRTPFLRSAMVFKHHGKEHLVRRGVLIPLRGDNRWACFDPDTLRWVVVWKAPKGQSPISLDSMAAISFPDKKAKAKRPPQLQGDILMIFPGLKAGESSRDPREQKLLSGASAVGPMPLKTGRWLGIRLQGDQPVIHYRLGDKIIYQAASTDPKHPLILKTQLLGETQSRRTQYDGTIAGFQSIGVDEPLVSGKHAEPLFPQKYTAKNQQPKNSGPFRIKNITFPKAQRPIRATDMAFLSNGTALLTTLDGDIWQVTGIHTGKSFWTRVATGLFEPLAIETTPDGKIYALGRDQITQLIDHNNDGHIDEFRCASDAFLQTLHTRDYATSLAIAGDGSYYIAKGGIVSMGGKQYTEMSTHRGAVVRISPDGKKAQVLADGLRLPYVGRRSDGVVFASDQQGHYVPSTPIFSLLPGADKQSFGFNLTNHGKKQISEPLLYFPYQHNRSAAAFCELVPLKSFPDFSPAFLQISWDGRIFGIVTADKGRSFAFRWPLQLDFPSLNAAVHPLTGELYTIGLGISGYKATTPKLTGIAALAQAVPFPTPIHLAIEKNTVTVKWNRPLKEDEAVIPVAPALRFFNVKRTKKYGSGHFLINDKPGEHRVHPTSVILSPDRQTLTMTFPSLVRSDIFDLKLQVSHGALTAPLHIYTRSDHLPDASQEDLELLMNKPLAKLEPGDATQGKNVFKTYSCMGCHSLTGEKLTGPPLTGLAKRLKPAEIRESILQPAKVLTKGYPAAMPSFAGVMTPQELEDLLAYLGTLKK